LGKKHNQEENKIIEGGIESLKDRMT
jgi:hypothetical protein